LRQILVFDAFDLLEKFDFLLAGEEVDGAFGEDCDGVGELVAQQPILKGTRLRL
jgi:hypothetical protein